MSPKHLDGHALVQGCFENACHIGVISECCQNTFGTIAGRDTFGMCVGLVQDIVRTTLGCLRYEFGMPSLWIFGQFRFVRFMSLSDAAQLRESSGNLRCLT